MRASASAGARANSRSALIGEKADLTYPYDYLGAGPDTLAELAARQAQLRRVLKKAERPLVIVGAGALARPDGAAVAALAAQGRRSSLAPSRTAGTALACCTRAASRVGALDIGFVPGEGGAQRRRRWRRPARSTCCSCSAPTRSTCAPGAFVVYIGTHGDSGAHRADVILPGAAYTEKSGIYVNTEGRVQMASRAEFPARRCARGLGDPARAVRRARPQAAL